MLEPAIVRLNVQGTLCPVLALEGQEQLSQPFFFDVSVSTESFSFRDTLIGHPVELRLQDAQGYLRAIHGTVTALQETNDTLQLTLEPRLAHGRSRQNTRAFLGRTRKQIIEQLLLECGYASSDIHWHGTIQEGALPAALLQAGETQLKFLQRLVAELQLFFWFESDGHTDQIHLANEFAQTPFCPPLISPEQGRKAIMNGESSPLTAQWQREHDAPVFPNEQRPLVPADSETTEQYTRFLPLSEAACTAAAQQGRAHQRATKAQWTLIGAYPGLSPGISLSPPPHWRTNDQHDDLTTVACQHTASAYDNAHPQLGMRYQVSATLLARASGYRPAFPTMPELPLVFPARIESSHAFAEPDAQGRYQFRFGFSEDNTETLPHTQASSATERAVPFANRNRQQPTGAHFPLLDDSTALVTLLNNDPNRPCILGFANNSQQTGPVTAENGQQSRVVTPAQNELTFDDADSHIVLQTFDGQTKLHLNAGAEIPYVQLAARYGGLSLYAGQHQHWRSGEQLIQKHSGSLSTEVKQHQTETTDGTRHLQAAKRQLVRAKGNVSYQSEANQSWQTKTSGMTVRTGQPIMIKSQGTQVTRISDGNYRVQATNDITLTGSDGDMLITNGTGGVKLSSDGTIKLFGAQITLKGQSGVTFNGDVEYELGAANEAEAAVSLEPEEIKEIEALELEGYAKEEPSYWFEVELVDTRGNPIADTEYVITTPTNEIHRGTTDPQGIARIEGLTSMEDCTVRFPNLDRPVR